MICQAATSTNASIITGRFTGKACTPIADLACIPTSRPYNVSIRSEKPLATSVVFVNPSTVFTITLTCSHAATLSNLPSLRLRLPNIDKAANFADSYPCSIDTSLVPSLPKGPAIEPSEFCGPWPEIYALSPRRRIHAEGVLTFGGTFSGCGILRPRELSLASIRSMLSSSSLLLLLYVGDVVILNFDISILKNVCTIRFLYVIGKTVKGT